MNLTTISTVLGFGELGRLVGYTQRQQITPNMTFTCEGMITKWIIGAFLGRNSAFYPELQIWRNIGNDTYKKINGTFITMHT